MPADSLIRLTNAARAGDQEAASSVFELTFPMLCQIISRRVSPGLQRRFDPEDVAQSAFRSFFVGLQDGRFNLEHSVAVRALLTTIALRKLNRARERNFAARRDVRSETGARHDDVAQTVASAEGKALLAEELQRVLSELSHRDRAIVEQRLQGLSIAQIARESECSEKTVHRVLQSLSAGNSESLSSSEGIGETIIECVLKEFSAFESSHPVGLSETSVSVSRFRLQRMIGSGSTSKVYQAIDQKGQIPVAVKFLRKQMQSDPAVVNVFLQELHHVSLVDSAAILKIHEIGRTKQGHVFLVTDLFDTDLSQLSRPITWQSAVSYCLPVAEALQACHDRGLIHCDIKPANLLVKASGEIAVCDFGLAKNINAADLLDIGPRGSLPWMAPEQLNSAEGLLRPETDIYGLGATLFHLLTGFPPYGPGPTQELISKIVNARCSPEFPDGQTDLPDALKRLCQQMLEPRPLCRIRSMAEVAMALRDVSAGF